MSTFKERYAKHYRDTKVTRGYNYHFIAIEPAVADKPTLLFLHGFPSHSNDWHYQVEHYHAKGYGLIVPDLLGYAGTDKPVDVTAYSLKAMSQDLVDIVDSLEWARASRVIVISHDWGSALHGRLAQWNPDRFFASVYLVVGGVPFYTSKTDFDTHLPMLKQMFGSELFAYQEFFTRAPDAAQVVEKNVDSLLDLLFGADIEKSKAYIVFRGTTEEWIRGDRRQPRASWLTQEDTDAMRSMLLEGGLTGPLNWYKGGTDGVWIEEDAELSAKKIKVPHPVLFIAAKRDFICLPAIGLHTAKEINTDVSYAEIDTTHWIMYEKPEEVNREIDAFLEKILAA